MAWTAGISRQAMLMEVERARGKRRGQERRELQRENLNTAALRQPRERSIRYTDLRSAMAEEGVVRLLLLDAALAESCRELAAGEFSSPFLGKLYQALLDGWSEGRTATVASMAALCSQEEMAHLTEMLHKPAAAAHADRALADYIQVIKASARRRMGEREADPLLAAVEKFKDKKTKGNGGKRL